MDEWHSALILIAAVIAVLAWRLLTEKNWNPMDIRYWPWRTRTWVIMRLRLLQCVLVGHNYDQHFNTFFSGAIPEEIPWCDNCGKDAP